MAKSVFDRAVEVAGGKRRASAVELVEMIRAVNPTGRELPARTAAERYALKSRLQSLLIRSFPTELRVEQSDDPSVVGLIHAPSGVDACHAPIDDLEDDARAWIRFQLDTEVFSTPGPRSSDPRRSRGSIERADTASPDALVRGRTALAEYDYDAARAAFDEALAAGVAEAGSALLEMLVEVLGDFRAAVELEPRLLRSDPRVETLLVLALARTGDLREARRRIDSLDSLDGPGIAEAWGALLTAAISARSLDEAEEIVEAARRRGVKHPELLDGEAALGRLRSEKRAPAEAALREAWSRGDEAEAERLAKVTGGPLAGQILREIDGRRRDTEGRRLLEEARAALSRGDDATFFVRRAAALGVSDPAVDDALSAHATRVREQQVSERVRWIASRAHEREGVLAFLDAPPEVQRAVRIAAGEPPHLQWAESLGSADAALALATRKGIERYAELLSRIPEGRSALASRRESVARERAEAAGAALEEALRFENANDDSRALDRMLALDREALDSDRRAQADALAARLESRRGAKRRAESFEKAIERGDLLEALTLARDGGDGWRRRADAVASDLAREWSLFSFACDIRIRDAAIPALEEAAGRRSALACSGQQLWLLVRAGHWTLLFETDVTRERVTRIARMRAPFGRGEPDCAVDGESLWIFGSELAVCLDTSSLAIRRGFRLRDHVPPGEIAHDVLLVPGTHWMWLHSEIGQADSFRARVLDLTQRRVRIDLGDLHPSTVPGSTFVFAGKLGGESRLYDARGADMRLDLPRHVHALGAHPAEEGFVAILCDEEHDAEIAVLAPNGRVIDRVSMEDASPQRIVELGVSRETGLVFATAFTGQGDFSNERSLFAWRPAGLELVWRTKIPRDSTLLSTSDGRTVVLVAGANGAMRSHVLGLRPPALELFHPRPHHFEYPDVEPPFICDERSRKSLPDPAETLAIRGDHAALERISRKLISRPLDLGVFLSSLVRHPEMRDKAHELLASAEQLHGDRPELMLARAEIALVERRGADAVAVLRELRSADLPISPRHLAHLLGIAHLSAGEPDAAAEAWRDGQKLDGECSLDRCLGLIESDGTPLSRIVSAIKEADAEPSPERRLEILAPHWAIDETQIRVRYAAAWLERDVQTEIDRLRKLAAVAWLGVYRCSIDLPVPGAAWDASRIAEIVKRAESWLETEADRLLSR